MEDIEEEEIDVLNNETFGAGTSPIDGLFFVFFFFFFFFSQIFFVCSDDDSAEFMTPQKFLQEKEEADKLRFMLETEGEENEEGSFRMDSIYESLVGEDDNEDVQGISKDAGPSAGQQYPPWFYNFPKYSPAQLAQMIWKGQVPAQVEQMLRARQAEFMQRMTAMQATSPQQPSPQPPQPSQLLREQNSQQQQQQQRERDQELFDRHHHTHLIYWKRGFKYMSAEEVDSLIAQQRSILRYSTFAEDYYYQKFMSEKFPDAPPPKTFPPLMGIHRPICLEPLDHPVRPEGDMFVGVLGKIPFSSIKAPRPIVQLQGRKDGVLNATASVAIQALEQGNPNKHAFLSVIEDGLLLVIHLSDMSSITPQLPAAEQPYFFMKQQHIIAKLVYILNVLVVKKESQDTSYFGEVLSFSKGRRFIGQCLGVLPLEQRMALLLVCLSNSALFCTFPEDDQRTRSLYAAVGKACSSLMIGPAVGALVAMSQGFKEMDSFASFVCSRYGAMVTACLLGCARKSLENDPHVTIPSQWPSVINGLFEALSKSFVTMTTCEETHPSWTVLWHMCVLVSPPQKLILKGLLKQPMQQAEKRLGTSISAQAKNVLHFASSD